MLVVVSLSPKRARHGRAGGMSSPHLAALLTCTGYVVDDVQRSFKDYVNRIKIDRSIIHFTKAQFCNFVSV